MDPYVLATCDSMNFMSSKLLKTSPQKETINQMSWAYVDISIATESHKIMVGQGQLYKAMQIGLSIISDRVKKCSDSPSGSREIELNFTGNRNPKVATF